MSLQPKTKRLLWVSAIVLVILLALGAFFTWTKFFREEKEVFANEKSISNTVPLARRATAAFRIISGWSCRVSFPT
jgi:flagellar basal body-associated protein FliL